MRNMSFGLTKEQFRARTKTVTRRLGWWVVAPGEIICGVERVMGFKKGEKLVKMGEIEVLESGGEPLRAITKAEVILEGFPDWTPEQFVEFFCRANKVQPTVTVNRILFRYVEENHDHNA